MNEQQILARQLANPTFRRELNTALWVAAFDNDGVLDPGWSCRDHAWLVAVLAAKLGVESHIFHGKAVFVGPKQTHFTQKTTLSNHSWSALMGLGFWDLSLKPTGVFPAFPLAPVVASRFLPPFQGTHYITSDEAEFDRAVAQIQPHISSTTAIYLGLEDEPVTSSTIAQASDSIRSPLTDWLNEKFGCADYTGLLLHLRQVLLGEEKPLAPHGQEAIWQHVLAA